MSEFRLNRDQYLELEKLGIGAFAPLQGFMTEDELRHVVEKMRLPDGSVFPLPVVLGVTSDEARTLRGRPRVTLTFDGQEVGELEPQSFYRCDKPAVARAIFGTDDCRHPGVAYFHAIGDVLVGGPVQLRRRARLDISDYELLPQETRSLFQERGWKRIVGFQTRNVPHRAHEYLQRVALELVDGLLIQPLVGRKKAGDFRPEAIMTAYRALIAEFFPPDKVVLGVLSTVMRYAGPREALFHAIIRRNYGCTHFIVGRDHAGVGNYYGKYDAHDLVRRFAGEVGIEIFCLHGPYYCSRCRGMVTEHTCPHFVRAPECIQEISGTDMRAILSDGKLPDPNLMRPEIVNAVSGMKLFVEESEL